MSKAKPEPTEAEPIGKPNRSRPRRLLRQIWRLIVLLGVGLLVCVTVFAMYAWVINAKADRKMHRIRHEMAKRGLMQLYPDYRDSINVWDADESATAAAFWKAAMDARPNAAKLPLPVVGGINLSDIEPRQQFHPDMVAAMRKVIAERPEFFQLVESARKATTPGSFQTDRNPNLFTEDLDLMGGARSLARWNLLRATLAQAEQDNAAFTDAILAILDFNHLLANEPGFLPLLVAISIDAMAREGVIEGLGRIELTTEQIDRLIAAFQRRLDSYDATAMVGYEISKDFDRVGHDAKAFIRFGEARRAYAVQRLEASDIGLFNLTVPSSPLKTYWNDLLLTHAPGRYELRYAETVDLALANYDELIALQSDPKKRWDWLSRQESEFQDEDLAADDYRAMRTLIFLPGLRTETRARSILAAGIAALKVERYRIEQGNWPDKLIDATGEPAIDAFGEALRYRKTTDGAIIYTVGHNTIDEQGYGQESDNVPSHLIEADDWASTLFNPELRNALPPPKKAIPDYDEWSDFDKALYDKPDQED